MAASRSLLASQFWPMFWPMGISWITQHFTNHQPVKLPKSNTAIFLWLSHLLENSDNSDPRPSLPRRETPLSTKKKSWKKSFSSHLCLSWLLGMQSFSVYLRNKMLPMPIKSQLTKDANLIPKWQLGISLMCAFSGSCYLSKRHCYVSCCVLNKSSHDIP